MENKEAWLLKFIGLALMVTSSLDFFELLPLPKSAAIPPAYQLGVAFFIGLALLVTPLTTLQGWINTIIGRKINKQ